jgi:N-acetyl-anhydromuramyl-L-alanine amidase AmpD
LTHPMMHGPAVKRLQEVGDQLGYDYGPNDGIFGEDTESMVKSFQSGHGLAVDGMAGDQTWKAMLDLMDAAADETRPLGANRTIYDIRGQHDRPKHYARKRRWSDIVGVTLHQTGCNMPQKPSSWKRLNAHIGITQEGLVVLVNDPTDMIWHAQGLSKRTIGIEIEGNYQGVAGNNNTLWKGGGGPHFLNDNMLCALQELLGWLTSEFSHNGVEWQSIFAHRQSSDARRGDPGSDIWQRVAMSWAESLGLKDEYDGGPYYCIGSGSAIPQLWNPSYPRKY